MGKFRKGPACPTYRHGLTDTPEHYVWSGMLDRCRNPNNHSWHRYGGRGIAVCERWLVFENFLADMGKRPDGTSLDRIDNDGPYSPENCRWATLLMQNRNKSTNVFLDLDGKRQTLTEWAADLEITIPALVFRLKSDDWSYRDALTLKGRRQVRGERHKLAKLSDEQAVEVVRRRRSGEKLSTLAREFGVSESRISKMALAAMRRVE